DVDETSNAELRVELQISEALDLAGEWAADVAAHVGGAAAAAAGEDEGDGPVLDLEVLEVVVVTAEIEVEVVLLENFSPLEHEDAVVAVRAVGENRMMGAGGGPF